MRMRKISEKVLNLEDLIQEFLLVKQSQHTGELAMRDYRNCLGDFFKHSRNSVSYDLLEDDALRYCETKKYSFLPSMKWSGMSRRMPGSAAARICRNRKLP